MFKFEIDEIVLVDGVKCKVLDREIYDKTQDYLCKPLDKDVIILGQDQLGSGWVLENNIKTLK